VTIIRMAVIRITSQTMRRTLPTTYPIAGVHSRLKVDAVEKHASHFLPIAKEISFDVGESKVKSSQLMALLVLIAGVFFSPASGMAQQNTAFSGPVSIQTNNGTNSALEVSRQGWQQPTAISSFTNGGGDAW